MQVPARPKFATLAEANGAFRHAVLCEGGDQPCTLPECTAKVAEFKEWFRKLRAHGHQCGAANLPSEMTCPVCEERRRLDLMIGAIRKQARPRTPAHVPQHNTLVEHVLYKYRLHAPQASGAFKRPRIDHPAVQSFDADEENHDDESDDAVRVGMAVLVDRVGAGEVAAVRGDVCDVELFDGDGGGKVIIRDVQPTERRIVCATCHQETIEMAAPKLRCDGDERVIGVGERFFCSAPWAGCSEGANLCRLCFNRLNDPANPERPRLMEQIDFDGAKFEPIVWQPDAAKASDQYVRCDVCNRWHHYICARFPAPEQLPSSYVLDDDQFACPRCVDEGRGEAASCARLRALQERSAADLPRTDLSNSIERVVAEELRSAGLALEGGIYVRVASTERLSFPAAVLQQRYGGEVAGELPYLSMGIFVWQQIDGHDVCVMGMYVQEYGADSPPPNTNRVYLSYLDTVRYVLPSTCRTPLFHAVLIGYLLDVATRGMTHVHLWVAPPQSGTDYIFHVKQKDEAHRNRPMPASKLRSWYEAMLSRATAKGIVRGVTTLDEHVKGLTSLRDFPLFDGDFFANKLPELLDESSKEPPEESSVGTGAAGAADGSAGASGAAARATRASRGAATAEPGLVRQSSGAVAKQVQGEVRGHRAHFLVATLNTDLAVPAPAPRPLLSNALFDSRARLNGTMREWQWQWDELRRAHFSSLMMLAHLGGPPTT